MVSTLLGNKSRETQAYIEGWVEVQKRERREIENETVCLAIVFITNRMGTINSTMTWHNFLSKRIFFTPFYNDSILSSSPLLLKFLVYDTAMVERKGNNKTKTRE